VTVNRITRYEYMLAMQRCTDRKEERNPSSEVHIQRYGTGDWCTD